MKYFQNITDLEQAKKHYRRLAMQLHPDKGGSALKFQQMQQEYKALLINLQDELNDIKYQSSEQSDLLEELSELAKVLIEKQVPQNYLKRKVINSQSPIEKTIYTEIISFLDKS